MQGEYYAYHVSAFRSITTFYSQVKSLVQPSVLPRFQHELPKLLLEQSHNNLLLDSSCEEKSINLIQEKHNA